MPCYCGGCDTCMRDQGYNVERMKAEEYWQTCAHRHDWHFVEWCKRNGVEIDAYGADEENQFIQDMIDGEDGSSCNINPESWDEESFLWF